MINSVYLKWWTLLLLLLTLFGIDFLEAELSDKLEIRAVAFDTGIFTLNNFLCNRSI